MAQKKMSELRIGQAVIRREAYIIWFAFVVKFLLFCIYGPLTTAAVRARNTLGVVVNCLQIVSLNYG